MPGHPENRARLERVMQTLADEGLLARMTQVAPQPIDLDLPARIIPGIPKDKVIVVESGISRHSEVTHLKELGANAVLIGETFMRERDVARKVKEVMYGQS